MRFYVYQKRALLKNIFFTCFAVLLFVMGVTSLFRGGSDGNYEGSQKELTGDSASHVSQPDHAQAVMGEPIYHGNTQRKEVALTFNVFWGEEYIKDLLAILKENDVKATFFMGGTWVEKFPDLTKAISQAKHEIGSHGYSHPHVDSLSKSDNLEEIQKTEALLYKITGKKPKVFAPPYGERGPTVLQAAEEAGYHTILWTADTIDWQRPAPEVIVRRVLDKAENGSIVLMHPTEPTVKALPDMIKGLKEKGYQLVTVSDMLKYIEDKKEDKI